MLADRSGTRLQRSIRARGGEPLLRIALTAVYKRTLRLKTNIGSRHPIGSVGVAIPACFHGAVMKCSSPIQDHFRLGDAHDRLCRRLWSGLLSLVSGVVLDDIIPATGKTRREIVALLGISRQQLQDILGERKPVSPAITARTGKMFGGSTGLCLRMQAAMTPGMPSAMWPSAGFPRWRSLDLAPMFGAASIFAADKLAVNDNRP